MPRKITTKELRERGLCIRCGKPNEDTNYSSCPKCRAKLREVRKNRVKSGVCTKCGRKAETGKTMCLVCLIDNREKSKYARERYETHIKDHKKEYNRKVYQQRVNDGICTMCGKRRPTGGFKICEICRKKKRITNRRSYNKRKKINPYIDRTEWASYEICYSCGIEPTFDGHRVCRKCYEKMCRQLENARKTADTSYFRQLNRGIRKVGKI